MAVGAAMGTAVLGSDAVLFRNIGALVGANGCGSDVATGSFVFEIDAVLFRNIGAFDGANGCSVMGAPEVAEKTGGTVVLGIPGMSAVDDGAGVATDSVGIMGGITTVLGDGVGYLDCMDVDGFTTGAVVGSCGSVSSFLFITKTITPAPIANNATNAHVNTTINMRIVRVCFFSVSCCMVGTG